MGILEVSLEVSFEGFKKRDNFHNLIPPYPGMSPFSFWKREQGHPPLKYPRVDFKLSEGVDRVLIGKYKTSRNRCLEFPRVFKGIVSNLFISRFGISESPRYCGQSTSIYRNGLSCAVPNSVLNRK
jgi:hypothetical protein